MIKRTILAAVIAISLILPPLPVSADSPTLTIIQPDPSEGVLIDVEYSSYAVGDTVNVVISSTNPERMISSFRLTATDGAGVTTVTIVGHSLFIDLGSGAKKYSFPMTAGGILLDNVTVGQVYPVYTPANVEGGEVKVGLSNWDQAESSSYPFLIGDTAKVFFRPVPGYVFESAKLVMSPIGLTSVIDTNNPNYNDGVYSFIVGAMQYNITDVIFRSAIPTYSISMPATVSHGSVIGSKTSGIQANENITLTFTPEFGYDFISAIISYTIGDKQVFITITPASTGYNAGSYTYTMPAANVNLYNVVFSTDQPPYAIYLPLMLH